MARRALSLVVGSLLVSAASAQAVADDVLAIERAQDRRGRDCLLRALGRARVDVTLRGESPVALARLLTAATGVDFAVMARRGRAGLPPLTLELRGLTLRQVLGVVQDASDYRFVYRAGLVQIRPKDEVREWTVLRVYDLRAAFAPLRDRPGPRLGLEPPGHEPLPEPEDEGKTLSGWTADRVVELVREHVARESWDRAGVSITESRGVLFVRQTPRNQARVRALLGTLGVLPRVP